MRWSILPLIVLAACTPSDGSETPAEHRIIELIGQLEDTRLDEASGLAASQHRHDRLWVINDSGKAIVHAIELAGGIAGQLRIDDTRNRDWEDLATTRIDDTPYLVVAEIGDNDARRDGYRLYVIEEPDLAEDRKLREDADWVVEFEYPDGPRDAEALAIDPADSTAYILTKRDIPPRLYAVPLRPTSEERIAARFLGAVHSLPKPQRRDLQVAPITKDWFWQPSAMDFSRDGRFAAVLTYEAVYLYRRAEGQSWYAAFNTEPLGLSIKRIRDAESIAFSADGRSLFLTVEAKHAPLFRIDLEDAIEKSTELADAP